MIGHWIYKPDISDIAVSTLNSSTLMSKHRIPTTQIFITFTRIFVSLTFVVTVYTALAEAVSSDSVVMKMNEESRLGLTLDEQKKEDKK